MRVKAVRSIKVLQKLTRMMFSFSTLLGEANLNSVLTAVFGLSEL